MFDSHCHFGPDPAGVLRRAAEAGVGRILAVGGSAGLDSSALAARAASMADPSLPEVFLACGRDRDQFDAPPCAADPSLLSAWGEIGLDYHYSPETRGRQLAHFLAQLEFASRAGLPVVVHTREADDDTLGALREVPSRGVVHCFTGSPEFCGKLLDLGFFISISGIVTFRLADNVRESAMAIPGDRLLVETDSPFLAPVPVRGRPNEPAYLAHTVRFLARLRGVDWRELAESTAANAARLLARQPAMPPSPPSAT